MTSSKTSAANLKDFVLVRRSDVSGPTSQTPTEETKSVISAPLKSPANVSMASSFVKTNKVYKFRLTYVVGAVSDVTGTLNFPVSLDASSYDDWSSISSMFDEFRVLGGKLHFVPDNRYSKSVSLTTPAVMFFDNDNSTSSVTAYNQAFQYRSSIVGAVDDPMTLSWRRPGVTASAYWTDVASPASSVGSATIFSAGLSASTTYGLLFAEIMVEARSRR